MTFFFHEQVIYHLLVAAILKTAIEETTKEVFIFNRRTQSCLMVTGTSGSYSVEVAYLPSTTVRNVQ